LQQGIIMKDLLKDDATSPDGKAAPTVSIPGGPLTAEDSSHSNPSPTTATNDATTSSSIAHPDASSSPSSSSVPSPSSSSSTTTSSSSPRARRYGPLSTHQLLRATPYYASPSSPPARPLGHVASGAVVALASGSNLNQPSGPHARIHILFQPRDRILRVGQDGNLEPVVEVSGEDVATGAQHPRQQHRPHAYEPPPPPSASAISAEDVGFVLEGWVAASVVKELARREWKRFALPLKPPEDREIGMDPFQDHTQQQLHVTSNSNTESESSEQESDHGLDRENAHGSSSATATSLAWDPATDHGDVWMVGYEMEQAEQQAAQKAKDVSHMMHSDSQATVHDQHEPDNLQHSTSDASVSSLDASDSPASHPPPILPPTQALLHLAPRTPPPDDHVSNSPAPTPISLDVDPLSILMAASSPSSSHDQPQTGSVELDDDEW